MIIYDTLKFSLARQREFLEYIGKKGIKKMIIKDELEEGLDELDILNKLFDKELITIEEFNIVKNRIIDKMILALHEEIKDTENS